MDYLNSPGNTEIGLMDNSLPTEALSESASSMTEPILASNTYSYLGFSLEDRAPSRSTPFVSYSSPGESELPGPEPDTVIASPTPAFASGFNEGPSCYPTPPFLGVEGFSVRQQPTSLEFGCLVTSQAEGMNQLIGRKEGHSTVPVALYSLEQNLKNLLHSFDATLDGNRLKGIIDVITHPLLAKDLDQTLRPLFEHWSSYKSLELPALGLPAQWRGIDAAAHYLRALDKDKESPYLNPIARRIGQVLLYFNYDDLCRHPKKHLSCSSPKANTSPKANKTYVLDSILAAYHDNPRYSESQQCHRDKITGYHVRRGKWWWMLAGTLGVGILLLGNTSLVHVMYVYRWLIAWLR